MKLKSLSLYLAISLFAFGASVYAQDSRTAPALGAPASDSESGVAELVPGETAPEMKDSDMGMPYAPADEKARIEAEAEAELDPVGALCKVLTKTKLCSTCTNLSDVGNCFKAIAKHPTTLKGICYAGCNKNVCKNSTLQGYCITYCCPANSGEITSCLQQNGGKKCPK